MLTCSDTFFYSFPYTRFKFWYLGMMTLSFEQAQNDIKTLSKKPSNDQLLKLYALYKQGSEGDVSGKRPGGFDFVGAAKFDAWSEQQGKSQQQAQQEYIALVTDLLAAGARE